MSNKNTENIIKELNDLAPSLVKLPKISTLSVPENYFENVEEQILSQLNLISYEGTKQVPSGYLEHVESDLATWLTLNDRKKVKEPILVSFLKYKKWLYSAAAIFTFATCALIVFNVQKENYPALEITQNDQDQYLHYVQENIDDFDINVLIENDLVEESDISLVAFETESPEYEPVLFMESEINF